MAPNDTNGKPEKIVYKELSYKLTGLFFEVHNTLNRFGRERQYGDLLETILKREKIPHEREGLNRSARFRSDDEERPLGYVKLRPQDFIVEEVDDKDEKISLNEECRRRRKGYLLLSDSGSTIQWLYRPHDKIPNLPLTCYSTDGELIGLMESAGKRQGGFTDFVTALIGPDWQSTPEFRDTLLGRLSRIVKSIPQPGSTVSVASGLAGEFIARIALGYEDIPEAGAIDLRNFQLRTFGGCIRDLRK